MTDTKAKAVGLEAAKRSENNRLTAMLEQHYDGRGRPATEDPDRCSECGHRTYGSRCWDCEDRARIA